MPVLPPWSRAAKRATTSRLVASSGVAISTCSPAVPCSSRACARLSRCPGSPSPTRRRRRHGRFALPRLPSQSPASTLHCHDVYAFTLGPVAALQVLRTQRRPAIRRYRFCCNRKPAFPDLPRQRPVRWPATQRVDHDTVAAAPPNQMPRVACGLPNTSRPRQPSIAHPPEHRNPSPSSRRHPGPHAFRI